MGDQSRTVTMAAPAKINLYLHVTGKRTDGYHLLDSLVAFAGIHDVVQVSPAPGVGLTVDGEFADQVPAGPDNLVLRAASKLAEGFEVERGAAIKLTKRLPVASGMGGGSADAAAAIKALAVFWNLDIGGEDMIEIAQELGADVPACLVGQAAFMAGIGEDLTQAPPLPPAWLVLVNPGIEVPTPEIFARRQGPFSEPARFDQEPADAAALASLLADRRNDLYEPACAVAPEIGTVLETLQALPGVLLARMTGSGATCFGLFADAGAATEATLSLARTRPDWWVKVASLESNSTRLHGG